MRFVLVSAPAVAVAEDGQTITVRLQDAQGTTLDLEARYTAIEDLASALGEARSKAHRTRRTLSVVDESVSSASILDALKGYRFSVADDKSQMRLELEFSTRQVDISLSVDQAADFVAEANRALELLRAPRQMN